jgi:hypothetical protein
MRTPRHSRYAVGPPVQPEVTIGPAYHPEFGYLCPSTVVRQGIRVAMISAGIGMLIGACVVLSLMDRRVADDQRSERTLTVGKTDRDWAATAKAADSENQPSPVALQGDTSMPVAQETCKDEGVSFLNSKCGSVKKRKAHASRSAAARLATIEIGRMSFAPEVGRPASAGMNGKSAQANGGPSRQPEQLPPPSTVAVERAAVPAMKSRSHARIRERSREPKGDGSNALAFASPYAQFYRHDGMYRGERNWSYRGEQNWSWSR